MRSAKSLAYHGHQFLTPSIARMEIAEELINLARFLIRALKTVVREYKKRKPQLK